MKSYLGHNRLVYDVDWTRQSDYVVTASADSTARCASFRSASFVSFAYRITLHSRTRTRTRSSTYEDYTLVQ